MMDQVQPVPAATAIPIPASNQQQATIDPSTIVYNAIPPLPAPSQNSNKTSSLSDDKIQQLINQGFTKGLVSTLQEIKEAYALRFWIVDNSGSMRNIDGHRIIATPNRENVQLVPCSRWEEIQACVEYHIQLAHLIGAPTRFRLLNHPGLQVGPQQFSISETICSVPYEDVQIGLNTIRSARPGGCTPLTKHIIEIHQEIQQMAPTLVITGRKVVVVIATDGLPTNEYGTGGTHPQREFIDALRLLEGLPIWLVIRLCTDEKSVVDFYGELDKQLEISMDVLDDFCGESKEIAIVNPWVNYALPLHRLREMGYHHRVFDMLDERPLTETEIRDYCIILFGKENFDGVPDPSLNWIEFLQFVSRLCDKEPSQWNPVQKRLSPWIDVNAMKFAGPCACTIL